MKLNALKLLSVALLGTALLTGCNSTPKAPGWPDGDPRPINADIKVKVQKTEGAKQ